MDIFDEQFLLLWNTLNKHSVEYIMVGGFATNIHGYNRSTDDIDIWVNDTASNRKNLGAAFEQLDIAPRDIVERMQFVPGWTNFSLSNGFRLDVMTDIKGLETLLFSECFELAVKVPIETIEVPFLHINHLIAAKKAANRSKDQIDILELEKIREYLESKKNDDKF